MNEMTGKENPKSYYPDESKIYRKVDDSSEFPENEIRLEKKLQSIGEYQINWSPQHKFPYWNAKAEIGHDIAGMHADSMSDYSGLVDGRVHACSKQK